MVNFSGKIISKDSLYLNHLNRGLRYGDALFESIRVINGRIAFWEDHYLRLMASMRIMRMNIPMSFTMEFLESQITATVDGNGLTDGFSRVRLTVFRNNGGLYLPQDNDVSYVIEANVLANGRFRIDGSSYEVELFKDFFINADMLSTLKTNNKAINVVGSIYAKENGYDNCILLNGSKQVVEALNGNVFLIKGKTVKTPPKKDGCLNGIVRKKLIAIIDKHEELILEETSISPFELQKADELFVTNSIIGIQPVTKYRKKEYHSTVATKLLDELNKIAKED
ncbi:branched-chain amino acid aminotransferase [Saonia flava]|uniref:branched-chain-amino-acid transaminase n=1 Tax=Saonia flava TaxID=523696 RepID=A0A846QX40_9FLAO|nr:aminotransferase class IV [Saonia flava]NJB70185.1 branched-chain amino acid aminotransferase [Saonia flava]